MNETIQLGEISITVARKDIKNVHLTVHPPDGRGVARARAGHSDARRCGDCARVALIGECTSDCSSGDTLVAQPQSMPSSSR